MARRTRRATAPPRAVTSCLLLGASAAALLGGDSTAQARPPAGVTPVVGAAIERVRVFSRNARVHRRAYVTLGADASNKPVAIPLVDLPTAVRADSLRVKCRSAKVVRVVTRRVRPILPRQKRAKELIAKIEKLLAAKRALRDERRLVRRQLRFLDKLGVADINQLARTPRGLRGPPKLYVGAWSTILDWTGLRTATLRKRLLAIADERRALRAKLHKLRVAGKRLQLDAARRTALRVIATLSGAAGKHRVELSYLVRGAYWKASYDLRYLPSKQAVEATYYALVSQQSGESWKHAQLRFSTGRAAQVVALPELPSWTIGRKRDFHPKPRPRLEPAPLYWHPGDPPRRVDVVLRRLRRLAGRPAKRARRKRPLRTASRPVDGLVDLRRSGDFRRYAARRLYYIDLYIWRLEQRARRQRDVIKLNCLRSKRRVLRQLARMLRRLQRRGTSQHQRRMRNRAIIVARAMQRQAARCIGQSRYRSALRGRLQREKNEARRRSRYYSRRRRHRFRADMPAKPKPSPARKPPAAAPPPPPAKADSSADADDDDGDAKQVQKVRPSSGALGGASAGVVLQSEAVPVSRRPGYRRTRKPRESVPWSNTGYRPPYVHPDLPAAAAKGFLYTLYAPGSHDVSASGVERRIPVLRKRLKVTPLHRIVPGRAKAAYLVGTLTNNTGRPILRGHANLFAGAMFTGRTFVRTSLPGTKLELALGVDDAVKVSRYTKQKTVVHGLFFKDDVTRYTVTVELANNHGYAINAEVIDQVPVVLGKKIEVKRYTSPSGFAKPDDQGRVRWRGRVPARSKKVLTFSFDLIRPKDWKVRQHGG